MLLGGGGGGGGGGGRAEGLNPFQRVLWLMVFLLSGLTGVEEQVVLEVGVFAETATAHVAFERPRPAVDVHVRFQITRRRERLGAEGALVRLLLFVTNQSTN